MIAPFCPKPKPCFYAVLERVKAGDTPKFVIKAQAGFYPPMLQLASRNGLISMNLMESKQSGCTKDNAPAMRLQAKNSFNFTGLKDYFVEGKLSGFAYGNPPQTPTYGKNKPKANPFYDYKDDGFLFVMHFNPNATTEKEKQTPL